MSEKGIISFPLGVSEKMGNLQIAIYIIGRIMVNHAISGTLFSQTCIERLVPGGDYYPNVGHWTSVSHFRLKIE
jgi:hypothetical protein